MGGVLVSQQIKKVFTSVLLAGTLLGLGGCASQPVNHAPLSEIQAYVPLAQKTDYRIGAGDEIEVKFFFTPELNDRVTVRPDGKISLMFAPNLQAEGLTAEELAANVRVLYAPHIKQLDLVVTVRTFASQKAYVGGEVSKPGTVPLTGNETALQVLAGAGWVTPAARKEGIVVVRRDASSRKERVYLINVSELERGVNMEQNVAIMPGDLILVPPSDVVAADRWVDQNIRQMLPLSMGASVTYDVNGNN